MKISRLSKAVGIFFVQGRKEFETRRRNAFSIFWTQRHEGSKARSFFEYIVAFTWNILPTFCEGLKIFNPSQPSETS